MIQLLQKYDFFCTKGLDVLVVGGLRLAQVTLSHALCHMWAWPESTTLPICQVVFGSCESLTKARVVGGEVGGDNIHLFVPVVHTSRSSP